MDNIIKADLFRYGALCGTKGFIKGMFIPGFRYVYFLRKASKHRKYSVRGLTFRLLLRRYSYKYGFQISPNTQIGKGFYIGHHGTIIINEKAKIGENCNIAPGVTIGKANRGMINGYPTIGNRVWIGTNSVIVGKINIGSNVLVAPNSVISFDVPDNAMVRGNPARIVETDKSVEGYINWVLD